MQVGLIGMGNLGTAVANLVAQNGYDVLGWEYQAPLVEEINTTRTNGRYLEGIKLAPKLSATTEITAVLRDSDVLFIAIPSVFVQSTLAAGNVWLCCLGHPSPMSLLVACPPWLSWLENVATNCSPWHKF